MPSLDKLPTMVPSRASVETRKVLVREATWLSTRPEQIVMRRLLPKSSWMESCTLSNPRKSISPDSSSGAPSAAIALLSWLTFLPPLKTVHPQRQKIASKPAFLVAGFPSKLNEKETPSFSVPCSSLKKAPVCSEPS